jgi:hypothetical protein
VAPAPFRLTACASTVSGVIVGLAVGGEVVVVAAGVVGCEVVVWVGGLVVVWVGWVVVVWAGVVVVLELLQLKNPIDSSNITDNVRVSHLNFFIFYLVLLYYHI